ncbi:MAG: nucleoside triphosphate pyrophosphohydrolase, partial [Dokdonella sp.]
MRKIDDLLAIMARLRDPDNGCPWDVEQSFETIVPYTIEEAYEVADAVDRRNYADLCDELGDLLLQVVFHARMAEEAGHFRFDDVVAAICNKMVTRHPHVFAQAKADTADEVLSNWDAIKRREREAAGEEDRSALAGIARGLPEWQRATKLQKRAAKVGFDWPDVDPVFDKLHEEIDEVRAEFVAGADPARLTDEIGDVLFVCTNLARHAHVEVSTALRQANA